jgi:hypothetical protein
MSEARPERNLRFARELWSACPFVRAGRRPTLANRARRKSREHVRESGRTVAFESGAAGRMRDCQLVPGPEDGAGAWAAPLLVARAYAHKD